VSNLEIHVLVEESEAPRAFYLASLGFPAVDALHVACPEKAHAGVLLTA
jgi:hypothetical protein